MSLYVLFHQGDVWTEDGFRSASSHKVDTILYSTVSKEWVKIVNPEYGYKTDHLYKIIKPEDIPKEIRLQALLLTGES